MVVLLEGSPISTEELWSSVSDHRILGHLPDQGPSPPIAQFAGQPNPGRVLVVPNFFHLRMMQATVFFWTFNAAEFFWYTSPDLCRDTIMSLTSWLGFCDDMRCQIWDLIDRCVPFQIMSNQFNLPQVDSNQVVETSRMMETGCT